MPTINARRLALNLVKLRERRAMTQRDVCTALELGSATITRYERGDGQPKMRDLRVLLEHYGATEEERLLCEDLRLKSKVKGWWAAEAYSGVVSPSYEMLCSLELEAATIEKVCPMVIHGPLQTHAYALSLDRGLPASPDTTAKRVDLRLQRMAALRGRTTPPDMTVLLDESVLRRTVGSPDVMIEQLQALLTLPDWITVQVLPMTGGSLVTPISAFTIFTIAGEITVADEGTLTASYYERADQVEWFTLQMGVAHRGSLSRAKSRQFITDLAKVYERHGTGIPQVPSER